MNDEPLIVPLTIHLRDDDTAAPYTSVSHAFSQAQPSCMTSWGLGASRPTGNRAGAAIGCQDGSIYLLRSSQPVLSQPPSSPPAPQSPSASPVLPSVFSKTSLRPLNNGRSSRRPTPLQSRGQSPMGSRPSSPTSFTSSTSLTSGPLHVSPRGRASSALSKTAAQAPKNYVDFEEEEQKLRGMLERSTVKDKTAMHQVLEMVATAVGPADDGMKGHVEQMVQDVAVDKSPVSTPAPEPLSPTPAREPRSPTLSHESLSPTLSPPVIQISPTTPPPALLKLSPASTPSRASPATTRPGSPTEETAAPLHLVLTQHILPTGVQKGGHIVSLLTLSRPYLVSLSSVGDVSVLSVLDGYCEASFPVSDGSASRDITRKTWEWRAMENVKISDADVLVVRGCECSSEETDKGPETRIVAIKLEISDVEGIEIKRMGDWTFDEDFANVGSFTADDGTAVVFVLKESSELFLHPLTTSRPAATTAPASPSQSSTHLPLTSLTISIPNPFKMRTPQRSMENLNEDVPNTNTLTLGEPVNAGVIGRPGAAVKGLRIWSGGRGVLWTDQEIELFDVFGLRVQAHGALSMPDVDEVSSLDGKKLIVFKKNTMLSIQTRSNHRFDVLRSISSVSPHAWSRVDASSFLYLACADTSVTLRIAWSREGSARSKNEEDLLSVSRSEDTVPKPRMSAILPLELDQTILGYTDGRVGVSSLADLLCNTPQGLPRRRSNAGLDGYISTLHVFQKAGGRPNIIVGGGDDGSVGIWDLLKLTLRARWVLFAAPLLKVSFVENGYAGLQAGLICISEDGTVAVIGLDEGFELLYIVPAASAPLLKVCMSEDNLVFLYENDRARLWDVKTHEFWRLMDSDKALELMEQGGWFTIDVQHDSRVAESLPLKPAPPRCVSRDCGTTVLLDVRQLDKFTSRPAPVVAHKPTAHEDGEGIAELPLDEGEKSVRLPKQLHMILPLLSGLFTFGLEDEIDAICTEDLGVARRALPVSCGHSGTSTCFSIPEASDAREVWQISPTATTFRLLALVTILRVCLSYEEFEKHAAVVIAFYVAALPDVIPQYQQPSLSLLARFWHDSSPDLQQAARTLFGSVIPRMSDDKIIELVELWQRQLPVLQPDASKDTSTSAQAVIITGHIAVEKYSLLSAGTLRDIASSIALYLHDDGSRHRVLAIELCSRGFHIWQHYIDAMDVLRSLFHCATNLRKDARPGVGNQARHAVLQIASSNTPLFMTTLSLDILHARSPENHRSIMLLVAFIVRKKPLVLYPSLPRLVEAVVKSLDPNSSSREAVLQAATVILDQLVMTYPAIAFNMKTQRLAVGTSEGAVIMYDLKTATRLYVLEGHRKRLSACSFSPDGRRLVTVSLEESVVMVWKVGSSFSQLFNPGGPPRQGHSGTEPYKTLNFNVGDEGCMTVAATLEWITFEWPAERSARLRIRDSTFTFNT